MLWGGIKMTLIIIFAIMVIIGFGLIALDHLSGWYAEWNMYVGTIIAAVFIIGLFICIPLYIYSGINSEVQYAQYIQEKDTIESMLDADKDIDRLLLNEKVIEYNNQIILAKMFSQRFITGDYYSKKVDWQALKLIEWR
jgi:cbb3-type cytochrome oxidase subunit 3